MFDNIDLRLPSKLRRESMNVEITSEEREFLHEMLEEEQKHLIQQIDHTDTRQFEDMLKRKLEVLENLKQKIERLG